MAQHAEDDPQARPLHGGSDACADEFFGLLANFCKNVAALSMVAKYVEDAAKKPRSTAASASGDGGPATTEVEKCGSAVPYHAGNALQTESL